MARDYGKKRGIGFVLIIIVLVYAIVSGGVALTTGRDCSDRGLVRASWNIFPPRWECSNGTTVPVN
jgi:hypothetical protein